MKIKPAFFLFEIVLLFLLSSFAFAEDDDYFFYEKDHVRGFISVGGDYRGMRSAFQDYVNDVVFYNGSQTIYHSYPDSAGTEILIDTLSYFGSATNDYERFDDYYLGLQFNVGAQYKQLQTWISFNFMPVQTSTRPSSSYTASLYSTPASEDLDYPTSISGDLYDASWFSYGMDWMFGWKLFGENATVNVIPAVGLGINLINIHLVSDFDFQDDSTMIWSEGRNRYYSTMASTFNAEVELRFNMGQMGIGAYAGYRVIRYDELSVEGLNIGEPDNNGDTWFLGARATWTFNSQWQRKQKSKL